MSKLIFVQDAASAKATLALMPKLSAALEKAGLTVDAVAADENALAAHIAAQAPAAPDTAAAIRQLFADAGVEIAEGEEPAAILQSLVTQSADAEPAAALRDGLTAAGLKLADGPVSKDSVKAAIDARISILTQEKLALNGVPTPVEEAPNVDPSQAPKPKSEATGRERLEASIKIGK